MFPIRPESIATAGAYIRRRQWCVLMLFALLLSGCSPSGAPATIAPAAATPVDASSAPMPTGAPPPPTVSEAAPTMAPTTDTAQATVVQSDQDASTLVASASTIQGPSDRKAFAVTILHTNDARGEIEPCG